MVKRKINNNIYIDWSVFRNGVAEDFTGLSVKLFIVERAGDKLEIDSFILQDNVVSFTWNADMQYGIGIYTILLEEYSEGRLVNSVDIADAIELVPHTELEDGDSDYISGATFTSDIDVNFKSIDIAKEASAQAMNDGISLQLLLNNAEDIYSRLLDEKGRLQELFDRLLQIISQLPQYETETISDYFELINIDGNTIVRAKATLASVGDLIAYANDEAIGGSGGATVELLSDWENYDETTASEIALSASLGYELKTSIDTINESISNIEQYTFSKSGSGNAIADVTISGTSVAFTKGNFVKTSSVGVSSGVASLDNTGKVPTSQMNSAVPLMTTRFDYDATYKYFIPKQYMDLYIHSGGLIVAGTVTGRTATYNNEGKSKTGDVISSTRNLYSYNADVLRNCAFVVTGDIYSDLVSGASIGDILYSDGSSWRLLKGSVNHIITSVCGLTGEILADDLKTNLKDSTLFWGITDDNINTWNGYIELIEANEDDISTLQGYFTNGYANNADNADKLDGKHLSEVFNSLSSNASNVVSITIGGTTKNITRSEMIDSINLNGYISEQLSNFTGSNKITTLGTITTGVWQGTKISTSYIESLSTSDIVGLESLIEGIQDSVDKKLNSAIFNELFEVVRNSDSSIKYIKAKGSFVSIGDIIAFHNDGESGSDTDISLSHLIDVAITSPTEGQVLTYNGTKWVNGASSSGLDVVTLKTYLDNNNYIQSSALNDYVLKESGKGLSTNDFTDAYKEVIDSLDEYKTSVSNSITALDTRISDVETELEDVYDELTQHIGLFNSMFEEYVSNGVTYIKAKKTLLVDGDVVAFYN